MKERASNGIAIIALILVVACLFQIATLKNQLRETYSGLSSQFADIRSSIANIHGNIEYTLNKQANLLDSSNWTYGEVDIDAKTAIVQCAVTPKEYRPDDTSVILVCNDTKYPMTLQNGEYVLMLPVPLFENSVFSKVQLIEGGAVRTETLDWWITPHYDFLPYIIAQFAGQSSSDTKDGIFNLRRVGEIAIRLNQKENNVSVQSISMLEFIDGAETERTSIPFNSTPSTRNFLMPEPASRLHNESASDFYYQLNKTAEIPFGSTYEMYIEVVDSYDLHYRVLIGRTIIDSDGNTKGGLSSWFGTEADVYDEKGNALWITEKVMF